MWVPAVLGSIFFVVGGVLECVHNDVAAMKRWGHTQWLSVFNALGGVLFLVGSVAGAAAWLVDGVGGAGLERWLVDVAYLSGSACFGAGSIIMVWLWKNERYGLGLLRELNKVHRDDDGAGDPADFVLDMQAQYGCGRASGAQIPWLCLYVLNATVAVVDVGLAIEVNGGLPRQGRQQAHRVANSVLNFALSHGILLLASVVHHVPTARPHSWLLYIVRAILLASCANEIYGCFLEIPGLL